MSGIHILAFIQGSVMGKRWKTSLSTVHNVCYPIIWCPKYRRKVLEGDVEVRLKGLLHEKAKELEIEIEDMEVMPDPLHLFVKASPALAPHHIVQQFKGATSRDYIKDQKNR